MAGYAAKYSSIGSNLWIDLWSDITTFRDVIIIVLSASLTHISANETFSPTDGLPWCAPTQMPGLVVFLVTSILSFAMILSRANIEWICFAPHPKLTRGLFEAPMKTGCITQYAFEIGWDVYGIFIGAILQMIVKPPRWTAAVEQSPGCTLFDSSIFMETWLLGEVLSFGSGIRILLFLIASLNQLEQRRIWVAYLIVIVLLSAAAVSLGAIVDTLASPLSSLLEDWQKASNSTVAGGEA